MGAAETREEDEQDKTRQEKALEKMRTRSKRSKTSSSREAQLDARAARPQKDLEQREVPPLPDDLWRRILKDVHRSDLFAFASTSKQLRRL